jgi:hypothetical protein
VRDISDEGYPDGDAPHSDCFQTYDSDAPPTFDVVLSGNRRERVGVQCLIATGKDGKVEDNVLIGEQPVYEADEDSGPVAAAGNRNQR